MLRNPLYVYGPQDVELPASLHFGEYILRKMFHFKNRIAFTNAANDESITYEQITQRAMNLAVSLTHLGLRKGETVAICSENKFEFWSVVAGVSCAGAVLTTINPGYSQDEMKHVMGISKPSYLIISPNSYKQHGELFKTFSHIRHIILLGDERVDNVIRYNDIAIANNGNGDVIVNNRLARNVKYEEFEVNDVNGQTDTLFILYSSGTTGLPKGVMLTHLNVLAQCCMPVMGDVNRNLLTMVPWFHVMGLNGLLTGLANGATFVSMEKFELDLCLRSIEKYKIAQMVVVPPVVVAICKAQGHYDLSSVDVFYCGAAPLHKETAALLKTKFPNMIGISQGYGMTEAGLNITRFSYEELPSIGVRKPGSVGMAVPGVTVKIVDLETGKALGPRQPGELRAKGLIIMKGYVGKDRNEDFDSEGFLRTGDVGYYDDDGCFYIVDRLKELIKYKGFQVAPAELEALLVKHDGVRDAGVVGVPDPSAGEVPLAFVVLQPGYQITEKEIQQYVAEKLSNPKHLRGGVRFVGEIPKNPSGKILRRSLREMAKATVSKL